jgi:hypothetical protein
LEISAQDAAAVLSLRLTLIDAASGAILSRQEIEQRVTLKERTAAALVAGWDEALNRAMEACVSGFKAAAGSRPAVRR